MVVELLAALGVAAGVVDPAPAGRALGAVLVGHVGLGADDRLDALLAGTPCRSRATPYMLPWSVIPIAGWPSATALATSSSSRAAPSSIENSVWTWRWVNESPNGTTPSSTDYSDVIRSTVAATPTHGSVDRAPASQVRARAIGVDRCCRGPAGRAAHRRRHRRRRELPRICSSCWRAASCWANSVAWMPWNRPSSQPTSWALATRSSPSDGHAAVVERQGQHAQLVLQVGRQRLGQLGDRALVDLGQALAAGARRAAPRGPPRAAA